MLLHYLVKYKCQQNKPLRTNYKVVLQATCLRCGGVVNIQVEKGLLLTVRVKKNLAKLQARAWLSHALCAPGQQIAKNEESAQDNHVFACNFVRYSPI